MSKFSTSSALFQLKQFAKMAAWITVVMVGTAAIRSYTLKSELPQATQPGAAVAPGLR